MLQHVPSAEPTPPRILIVARGEPLPGLRRARYGRGLTQEELATKAKVNRTTIGLIEAQGKAADPSTIRKLAAALKVQPAELMQSER